MSVWSDRITAAAPHPCPPTNLCRGIVSTKKGHGCGMECTPKVRQTIKGPATLNGGEQCWCPDKSIPVN
jgi:hypothetical protein